jgi:hypothetical protein
MATKKRRLDRTELDAKGTAVESDGAASDANGHAESELIAPRPDRRAAKPRDRENAPFTLPPLDPDLYINRELSWLEFNRRVLDRARDHDTPLLERVKFASIFCSNLDEFFMIRVAGLERKLSLGISDPGFDGRTPSAVFTLVTTTCCRRLRTPVSTSCHTMTSRPTIAKRCRRSSSRRSFRS